MKKKQFDLFIYRKELKKAGMNCHRYTYSGKHFDLFSSFNSCRIFYEKTEQHYRDIYLNGCEEKAQAISEGFHICVFVGRQLILRNTSCLVLKKKSIESLCVM